MLAAQSDPLMMLHCNALWSARLLHLGPLIAREDTKVRGRVPRETLVDIGEGLHRQCRTRDEDKLVLWAPHASACHGCLEKRVHSADKVKAVFRLDRRDYLIEVLGANVFEAARLGLTVNERLVIHAPFCSCEKAVPDFFIVDPAIDEEQKEELRPQRLRNRRVGQRQACAAITGTAAPETVAPATHCAFLNPGRERGAHEEEPCPCASRKAGRHSAFLVARQIVLRLITAGNLPAAAAAATLQAAGHPSKAGSPPQEGVRRPPPARGPSRA
mmetsp:Transcript_46302/g.104978  ORF Transcript_46302/g.104978 Transcript_46302/m.104978 type:complete len:272 (+) Transcript_46302:395-1210(+)